MVERAQSPGRAAAASWLLVGTTAVLLFISLWIVVPAPNLTLLNLGVVAPELSPGLLVASIVLAALAWPGRAQRIHRAAGCLAVTAGVLDALPLAGVPVAVRRFDEAINILGRVGDGAGTDAGTRGRMRSRPMRARDLVLGIGAGESRVVRDIEFAAPAGQPLTVDIYRPITAGRFPILVQIYGRAWQHGTPGDNAVFARYFASRGHVVFAIEYRHAPRWQWPAQIEDVSVALAWIRAHAIEYDGDMRRIALIGRSAGAQLALVAAYRDSANVAAVVSYYGPTNLSEGWRVPPRPDPLYTERFLAWALRP